MRLIQTLPLCALLACTQFPELDNVVSATAQDGDFPAIVSLDGLLETANTSSVTPQTIPNLDARLARLNARATGLRGPIIDRATRARMARGVQRS
ncbi:hypothetical protein [Nereida sp. MMG025]|uniref:hypothetical protein n=1 Tax=Nereida sp. MMG025 TaxID=2909981 RepID=UPI001F2C8631|nr:hypothetical protein [Nereida sp. MMG025]MCF6445120.1 hypothetical protein [Nereida sp. MMG025]